MIKKYFIYGSMTMIVFVFLVINMAIAESGIAIIRGTEKGSLIKGRVEFEDVSEGLKVVVRLENVPRGKHGFHIHEFGLITNGGKDAGGHFNPYGTQHGYLPDDLFENAHAGDLGNIEIGPDGKGALFLLIPGLTLSDDTNSVAGRSVILHEKEDDFGQPTGNAGARIGAGTIKITGR